MKQWSDVPVTHDVCEPHFENYWTAVLVCRLCGRPSILDNEELHTCFEENSDEHSIIFSKHSTSSASKPSRRSLASGNNGNATVSRKIRKTNLDLDRHCGVIIAPSGVPCMRSLTCKSHSAASKRAIIGRSKDFDTLYNEFIIANPSKAPNVPLTATGTISGRSALSADQKSLPPEPVSESFFDSALRFRCKPYTRLSGGGAFVARHASKHFWISHHLRTVMAPPMQQCAETMRRALSISEAS